MKKYKLKLKNILLLFIILVILVLAGWYLSYRLNYIPHGMYTNKDFDIETYISPNDCDGDGVDDQTDILQNVHAYVAANTTLQGIPMMSTVSAQMLWLRVFWERGTTCASLWTTTAMRIPKTTKTNL
mgnify:CR=1 FL=1